jgi:phosphoserine phosphatase RsbU/P
MNDLNGRNSADGLSSIKLEAYESLSKFVSSDFKLNEALNDTLDTIIESFNVKAGSIMLLDSSREVIDFSVVRGENTAPLKNIIIRKGEGIAGKVAETGISMLVNNTGKEKDFAVNVASQTHYIPQKILCVPLKVKQSVYGVIEIMDKKDGTDFSTEDLDLLQSASAPIAILIENITLFKNTDDDIKRLRTLMQVNNKINTTMDLDGLLSAIMSAAQDILRAEGSSLLLIDEKTDELYFNVVENVGDKKDVLKQIRIPIGIGIAGICAKTGESLLINDAPNDRRVFRKADEMTSLKTRNIICVPMRIQDRLVGVLEVINSMGKRNFDDYDLNILQSMADQAGIAIYNRSLINSLQTSNVSLERRIKELTAINRISLFISKNLDYNVRDILKASVKLVSEILEVERVSIFLHDEKNSVFRISAAEGISEEYFETMEVPMSNKIMGHVFNSAGTLVVSDLSKEPDFGRYKRFRYHTKSFICSPIRIKQRVIGVINLADKKNGSAFDKDDIQTIETIANQISESYENAVFYKEIIEKQRIEKELEVAGEIQKSILPQVFPIGEEIDVSASSIPALEIGGDFYDLIKVAEGKYAVYIADVSGKGVPASLFMALSHSIMKIQSLQLKDPSPVLEMANSYVMADSRNGMFVTLFYLLIDFNMGHFRFACAGHNEQLFYDSAEKELKLLKVKGIPLGVLPTSRYPSGSQKFRKGDIVVLFTDGVVEAINQRNEEYSIDRLMKVVHENIRKNAAEIRDSIKDDVLRFCGNVRQADDLTLMILKFN